MKDKPDKKHYIPMVICSGCGEETPLTYVSSWSKDKVTIHIWATPCCDLVPLEEKDIKGYISVADLEAMGYKKEEK